MTIKTNHKENLTLLGLLTFVLMSGIVLALPKATADDGATSNVAIRVNSACSMVTSPEGSNDTPHTADLNPGTYQANIGKTTLKTICNDAEGFSIYAIGYTNEEYGNTTLKPVTLDATQNSIITGTATTAGNPDISNWAMKVSPVTGTYAPTIESDTDGSFSDYHKVPSTYTKVATKTSNTDITTGSSIEITYSAYIAGTQPADLYNGKVKFTMVHPATEPAPYTGETTQSGKICYYANGSNVDGTMGCQTISDYMKDWSQCVIGTDYSTTCTDSNWNNVSVSSLPSVDYATLNLLASNFSRSGYGFAGWSDKFDYSTGAHFYGPNETISIPDTSVYTDEGKGLSLYAVWIKSAGSLQDSSKVSQVCNALTQAPIDGTANRSSVSALTDERDNQTYAIAKLADGNCWMIENLRLESTATANTTGSLAQGYNSGFIGLATAESADFSNSTTANSLYTTESNIEGKNTISGSLQAYRFPRYNNTNTSARASSPTANSGSMYSYGNYYTWHAAIADTTHNGTNNNSSDTTSICPKGWRLPHGGQTTVNTTAEFYLLGKAIMKDNQGNSIEPDQSASNGYGYYGNSVTNSANKTATNAFRSYPNNFLYSGNFSTSSASGRGSYGLYWSSTAFGSNGSYYLYLNSSKVSPGTGGYDKHRGLSIRCLAV